MKKIAFFFKNGEDSFINDIIKKLSGKFIIKKIIVTQYQQINEGLAWADIGWFEWCNDLIVYASKLDLAKNKKIVCRLHRYEILTDYPILVDWENVNKLILVSEHVLKMLKNIVKNIDKIVSIDIVHNGVDLEKFTFQKKEKGFKLAFVANIRWVKNPMMLLQIMNKLVKINPRYKLYVAGNFVEDETIKIYWEYLVKEMSLENNIVCEGYIDDINHWLDDKNYIISTSVYESFGYNIGEAMAKGIKPVIHNFPSAKDNWDIKFLFTSIDEAVSMIVSSEYCSEKYRKFIKDKYSLKQQIDRIDEILLNLPEKEKEVNADSTQSNLKKGVILFGASTLGITCYEYLHIKNQVKYFCDNDPKKWGAKIKDIEIISPAKLKEISDNYEIIITSSYYKEVSLQLKDMGIKKYKTFLCSIV